jgi:eukaryotic-like serine/threonine-protein kinase
MVPPNESNTTTGTISGFLQAIRSSSLLSEPQFKKLEANLAEGEYPPDPAEVSSRLIKDGALTEFQARQILKGKSQSLVFGRYVILDFLGKGTMGKVYKARHRMMGRVVALKILEAQYLSNVRSLSRFQREMHLVARLDHPNVVRAFDADRIGDYHFIAMEYVAGHNLQDLMKARGALPPGDVVYFASQAADGLAHAHAQGVLHRDIKPSNLMLTEARKVKILDFGLGTLLQQDELPSELTAAGITVGTPDYLSPEQARMLKLDGRSDLYSLGCTIYHLLSGQLPFKGESSMDCIVSRITGQAVPISDVRPGLPPRVIQVIDKLMATNPDDRYQTADEAADALRSLLRPKTAPPIRSEPAAAANAPVPAPVPSAVSESQASPPLVLARNRLLKPKNGTLLSQWTDRLTKNKRVLTAVAAVALGLPVVGILAFRSRRDERLESKQEALHTAPQETLITAPQETLITAPQKTSQTAPQDASQTNSREASRTNNPPVGPTAASAARSPGLMIENPKEGAIVGMREDLTGRFESEGWPVVFVQADIPGQPWWCQAPVGKLEGKRFSTKVVFGDDFTRSGTRFRIAGVLARTREEALKFPLGSKSQDLPEGLPRSDVVVVTHR